MIKDIDRLTCLSCGLCENICPTDVFRSRSREVYVAYQDDCCNCMQCFFVCPVNAIVLTPGVPKKYNAVLRWQRMKTALGME